MRCSHEPVRRHPQPHGDQGRHHSLDALSLYGCFRLASRINDLRNRGHEILTTEITLDNGKTIASYTLIKEVQRELPL